MKAIILAAGQGKRLRPFTSDRPKCLVEIAGTTLLDLQLEVLRSRGIDEIVLVGGYRSQMLRDKGSRLYVNPRFAETNMAWTLFCAEKELNGNVIVTYGDIVYSGEVLDRLIASPADIGVAIDLAWESYWNVRNTNPLDDAESLRLGNDGRIREIGGRPGSLDEIEGQYMGLMKFTHEGLKSLESVAKRLLVQLKSGAVPLENSFMTDLLQIAIDSGVRVDSVPVHGRWVEVDTVSDLHLPLTLERVAAISDEVRG